MHFNSTETLFYSFIINATLIYPENGYIGAAKGWGSITARLFCELLKANFSESIDYLLVFSMGFEIYWNIKQMSPSLPVSALPMEQIQWQKFLLWCIWKSKWTFRQQVLQ